MPDVRIEVRIDDESKEEIEAKKVDVEAKVISELETTSKEEIEVMRVDDDKLKKIGPHELY